MPKSRVKKHGSGKVFRPKPLIYDPVYTEGLSDDLRHTLKTKLTLKELVELEAQLRGCIKETEEKATIDTHKTTWAVVLRVLHDRFGFETEQKKALYDACTDYLHDIAEGLLKLDDILNALENEDGVRITYSEGGE